jgi:hypothetical protein
VSRFNSLYKTEWDDNSNDPSYSAILDLTSNGGIDLSFLKEDGNNPSLDAKPDLKSHTRLSQVCKDSPRIEQPTKTSRVPRTLVGIARKHERIEEEDEEITLALRFKKIKGNAKNAKSVIYQQLVVGRARDSNLNVDLEALPSNFHASSQ